jgi:hypothetical protein
VARSSILLDRAASFVDDTSSNPARASGHRVSIHAQVLGECALEWFYRLLRQFPNEGRELKSDVLASAYLSLASNEQDRLLRTLRMVRLHIIDPRPYMRSLQGAVERMVPDQTVEGFLTCLGQVEKSVEERLRRTLMESVASNMLSNSPFEQVKRRFRMLNAVAGISIDLIDDDVYDEPTFEYSPFVNKIGHLSVDRVSVFISKAGPVFSSALQLTDNLMGGGRGKIPSVWNVSLSLQRQLLALHVFDDGNQKALSWVENRRSETLSLVDPFGFAMMLPAPSPLACVDSRTSPHVQAADVAAGIARWLFENDPARLRATFDYVTLNGRQIGAAGT